MSGRRATGPGTTTIITGCPGVWVAAAAAGLLWTPGYWAFVGGALSLPPGLLGSARRLLRRRQLRLRLQRPRLRGRTLGRQPVRLQRHRQQFRRRPHHQRLHPAGTGRPGRRARELQRRSRRRRAETHAGAGAPDDRGAHPADAASGHPGARGQHGRDAVPLGQPGQARGRGDRASRRFQGPGGVPAKAAGSAELSPGDAERRRET